MNELNTEEQINTEEKERAKNQTKKCSEDPPVDAESSPLDASLEVMEFREKVVFWSGQVYHVGDCTIKNMRCSDKYGVVPRFLIKHMLRHNSEVESRFFLH